MTIVNISIFDSTINSEIINVRDLQQFLDIGKDFSNWIKGCIDQYNFVENQNFATCSPVLASVMYVGHNRIDYHISLDMAKELSMVERNAKGEELVKNDFESSSDMTTLQLLERHMILVQKAIEQEKKIKSKLIEKLEFDEGLVYVTEISNQFGVNPVQFLDFLKKLKIVSDTEKTVCSEFVHLFKYTKKYMSNSNKFTKRLKVNIDGVVFLIDLITNGIKKVSDFNKLSRIDIPDFVDNNSTIFENIISKYISK